MLVVATPCVFVYRSTHPTAHKPVGAGGRSTRRPAPAAWPAPYAPPAPPAPLPAWARGTDAFASSVFLSNGRHFETQTIERQLRRNKFVVTADYPQLVGDERSAVQQFNATVVALVSTDIEPYLQAKRDRAKERNPHWRDVEEYHHVTHKIVFASDDLVSVLFYVSGYSWGAAHGYHYPLVLNYDLRRGRVLRLADLFKPGADYVPQLARYCRDDLERQLSRDMMALGDLSEEDAQKASTYRAWVLTPLGLAIIFKEYQVGPYAAGEPKVLLPYARLRDIIDPRGPVGEIAALN